MYFNYLWKQKTVLKILKGPEKKIVLERLNNLLPLGWDEKKNWYLLIVSPYVALISCWSRFLIFLRNHWFLSFKSNTSSIRSSITLSGILSSTWKNMGRNDNTFIWITYLLWMATSAAFTKWLVPISEIKSKLYYSFHNLSF